MEDKTWYALAAALLVMTVLGSNPSQADTSVFAGAWSKHLSGGDYNENHRLLAVEHSNVLVGYFKNSYSDDSFTAAYRFAWEYDSVTTGVYVGGVWGYRDCTKGSADNGKKLCPMAAPFITVDTGTVRPQIFLLGDALAVSIKIKL